MSPRFFTFAAGAVGEWNIVTINHVTGESLPTAPKLSVVNGPAAPGAIWTLQGVTSNERYVTRPEKEALVAKQAAIGRPGATHGALIPIRKNAQWWAMTQDERRAVLEDQSQHIKVGLKYLPAVARRLHHCRDLDSPQPFDFVTYFDYAKADSAAFEDLVDQLRSSPEWKFVDREVDIRLERAR